MIVQIREKSYFGEKFQVPSYRLLPYSILKNNNLELGKPNLLWNCKMLIDPVGFRRNKTNLDYVFQVKSFG